MADYYLTYMSIGTQCKNQLEKDAYDYLRSTDRTLIHANDVTKFKNEVNANIAKLNELHKRCKPVKVTWTRNPNYFSLSIGSGFCNYKLLASASIY